MVPGTATAEIMQNLLIVDVEAASGFFTVMSEVEFPVYPAGSVSADAKALMGSMQIINARMIANILIDFIICPPNNRYEIG